MLSAVIASPPNRIKSAHGGSMITHLILTAFAIEQPAENGAIVATAEQTVVFKSVQRVNETGNNLPFGAEAWSAPLDPNDRAPRAMDFAALLDGEARIAAIVSITVSAQGASTGVQIDQAAGRAPIISDDGRRIQMYLLVNDALQANKAFEGAGLKVGITALVRTDEEPFEQYARTGVQTVRHL